MGRRRNLLALGTILVGALVGRVIYVITVTRHQAITSDEFYYATMASQFADGEGFTSVGFFEPRGAELADHPPLTSLLLAPWIRLTGPQSDVPRCVVAVLGVLVVVLIALVAHEVAGPRAALIAAAVAAVYPNLWINDGLLMSETFAALATALTVWCVYRLRRSPTLWTAALAGVAAALAGLARAEMVLLLPLLVLPLVVRLPDRSAGNRIRLGAAGALAGIITLTPWVAYNLNRFEKPVLLSMDGGTLLGANCDDTYAGPRLGFWNGYCTLPPPASGDASVHTAEMRRAALDYMGDHLGRLPVVVSARIGRTWGVFRPFQPVEWNERDGRPPWMSLAGIWSFWLVGGFAIAGAVVLRKRGESLLILVMPLVVVTLATVAAYGRERFRVPAEISVVVLAAVAVDRLVDRVRPSAMTTVGRADGALGCPPHPDGPAHEPVRRDNPDPRAPG